MLRPPSPAAARLRRLGLAAAAASSLVLSASLVAEPVTWAATACAVTYTVTNQWNTSSSAGGFQADLKIANTGPSAITGWTLSFAFPNGQTLTNLWNATPSQSGASVSATNLSWNATIGPGAAADVGFTANWSGANTAPASFALNGTTCTSTLAGPTTTPTATAAAVASATPTRTATTPAPTATPTRAAAATSTPTATATPGGPSPTPTPSPGGPSPTPTPTPPPGVHVANPFAGATGFANPRWVANVESDAQAAAAAGNSTLAGQMRSLEHTSTAVWLDRIAAVNGTDGGLGLTGYLDAAVSQQPAGVPETILFVIYDLPGRDCNALASNGELPATAAGLQTYQGSYIDPIAQTLGQAKYSSLRIVTIIEPDSLPNIVTNASVQACATAAPFYEQGVAYALNKLHAIPNVYTYVDAAHAGWLGWPNNASGAVNEFIKVANMTTAKFASIDGFVTDTANYTPLQEPFFTATTTISGQQVMSGSFYQFNPDVDEGTYSTDLWTQLTAPGRFPSSMLMLMDTSRNGWGCTTINNCPITSTSPPAGGVRPTAASTSTDLNTFVAASKVDRRPHRGAWCNQSGAGLGQRPAASPAGFPHIAAFVWVKPPGESDGASQQIANNEGKGFDRMCDPTFNAPALNGALTNALPNAPLSGHWFSAQFQQLVQNAFPAL